MSTMDLLQTPSAGIGNAHNPHGVSHAVPAKAASTGMKHKPPPSKAPSAPPAVDAPRREIVRDRKSSVKYEGPGLPVPKKDAWSTAPGPPAKKKGGKAKPVPAGQASSSSSKPTPAPVPQQGITDIVHYMSSEPQPKRVIWVPPSVALSERDRAKQLVLSTDQMEVTGVNGGYRMNRATHGVHNGAYFWEVEVLPPAVADEAGVAVAVDPSQCHTRVGWSTRQGELQGPVGNDKHGFGYRDIAGSKVHGGERVDHYGADYGPGDIIGCFLYLDVDDVSNNQMRFFKNGHDQGVAYRGGEIPLGVYFPAVSVYMQAHVRVNFGPSFLLKHDIFGANAVSEVQPMNPEDRKAHDARIAGIRATNPACLALKAQGGSVGGVSL